jgi:hypothetical protein
LAKRVPEANQSPKGTPLLLPRLHPQLLVIALDRIAYVNAPLFAADFLKHYNKFMGLCYGTYSGWGRDAKLRTQYQRRAEAAADRWVEEWADCFADEHECPDAKVLRNAYGEFVAYLAKEIGVGVQSEPIATGRPPANIR